MEIIEQNQIEQWDNTIDEGVSRLMSIQPTLKGIGNALDIMGMDESIKDSLRQIEEASDDLRCQVILIEEEIKNETDYEVIRLDNGELAIVDSK